MLIFSLLNTVGLKIRPTPNGLYSIPTVPRPWGTGTGNSPPARKLADCPLRVVSVGYANILRRPSSFNASIKPVQV
jgi:hypothetical protein